MGTVRRGAGRFVLVLSLAVSALLLAQGAAFRTEGWLGWLALAPLLLAVRTLNPSRAVFAGGFWGLCFYAFSVAIGSRSIHAGPGTLTLLIAVLAAYACLGALATRAVGFFPWVLGLLWMLVEIALKPLGLRYGLLAGTLGEGGLLHWLGGALGYLFVAFVVACGNVWLLALLDHVASCWQFLPKRSAAMWVSPSGDVQAGTSLLVDRLVPCASHARAPPVL